MNASPAVAVPAPGSVTPDTEMEELPELDLHDVTPANPAAARTVVAVGAVGAVLVLYALFGLATGGVGTVPLALLLVGLLVLFLAYRQVSAAQSGALADLGARFSAQGRPGSIPKASVRRAGDLFDI